jgi:hypothetical protein
MERRAESPFDAEMVANGIPVVRSEHASSIRNETSRRSTGATKGLEEQIRQRRRVNGLATGEVLDVFRESINQNEDSVVALVAKLGFRKISDEIQREIFPGALRDLERL